MKYFLILFILIFTLSCSNNKSSDKDVLAYSYELDWLEGKWIRKNDKIEKQTFENWEKIDSNNYIGLGYTLMNSDTTFREDLRMIRNSGAWTLEVRGVNAEMTPFVFIKQSDSSFTCENKANEFPKIIAYNINNKILTAIISDDKTEISFIFEKTIQ